MKRNDPLAAALERLLGAAESLAAEMRRGDCHQTASSGGHRVPAEVLLAILERRKAS